MKTSKITSIFLLIAFCLQLFGGTAFAGERFDAYLEPSIKNNYCGPIMNYKYCKCAFHGQFCDDLGIDTGTASSYVQSGYTEWANQQRNVAQMDCNRNGGKWVNKGGTYGCLACGHPHYTVGNSCEHIEDLCSADPVIRYDEQDRSCYCPEEFTMETVEGELACVETPEVEIVVTPLEQPPYMADGQTTVDFEVQAKKLDTDQPLDVEFSIEYTSIGEQGKVLETSGTRGDYVVTYQTPKVDDKDIEGGMNGLYMFYHSRRTGEKKYETYQIDLYTREKAVAHISKHGFVTQKVEIPFKSQYTDVFVYTKAEDGSQHPVNAAHIEYQELWSYDTDEEGTAKVESPKKIDDEAAEGEKLEVFLEMEDEVKAFRNNAWVKYSEMAIYGIGNDTVQDFVLHFNSHLAKQPDDTQAKKAIAGIKVAPYIFFYLKQGNKLGEDAADALADAIGGAVWDLADLISSFDLIKNPLKKYMQGKTGVLDFQISEKVSDSFRMDLVTKIASTFDEAQDGIVKGFMTFVRAVAADAAVGTRFSPNWLDGILKEIMDALLQEGINKWGDLASLKGYLSGKLKNQNKDLANDLLVVLAGQINRNNFNEYVSDARLETAKENYVEFTDQYLKTHDLEYNATMLKQWTELGFNIFGKAAQILAPGTVGEIATLLEKIYKGVRSGVINNAQLLLWINAFSENQSLMNRNINRILGLADAQGPRQYARFMPLVAGAQEQSDVLDNLYNSELSKESQEYQDVKEYVLAKESYEFYASLAELTEMLVEVEPENQEIVELNEKFKVERDQNKEVYESKKQLVQDLGLDEDSESYEPFTLGEWIILLFILGFFGAIIWGIIKLIKFIYRKIKS